MLRSAQNSTEAAIAMNNFERFGAGGGGYQNVNGSESQARIASANKFFNGQEIPGARPGFMGRNYAQNHMLADSGKPAVASLARGTNAGLIDKDGKVTPNNGALDSIISKATGALGGFPLPGGEGSFEEAKSGLAPANYDMITVLATKSHPSALVVNDVSGAETILLHHGTTGAKYEMGTDGNTVSRSTKNHYIVSGGDQYIGSGGDLNVGVKGMLS